MALKFSLEKPIVIEEPKQKTGQRAPVANQSSRRCTSETEEKQNCPEARSDGRFSTESTLNQSSDRCTSETPSQLILLADNGHLRVEVTYDDAAHNPADKLEQFKCALETLRILQSLHDGPTEEVDENGNKTTWPPLPDRIRNGEVYLAQQRRVMGPDRERRVAEENCKVAEVRLSELRAKVDSWQAREDAEYERIEALERDLAGPGCLLCWQCGSAVRVGESCSCWGSGEHEVRIV